jgi:hypothetical protein
MICTAHQYYSGNQIKKNEMGWVCSTYWKGEVYAGFWWGNLRERDHLEDPGVDWRIILSWIFRNWNVGVWTGSSWLRIGTGGGTCKLGEELSGSIKFGKFLDWLNTG